LIARYPSIGTLCPNFILNSSVTLFYPPKFESEFAVNNSKDVQGVIVLVVGKLKYYFSFPLTYSYPVISYEFEKEYGGFIKLKIEIVILPGF